MLKKSSGRPVLVVLYENIQKNRTTEVENAWGEGGKDGRKNGERKDFHTTKGVHVGL